MYKVHFYLFNFACFVHVSKLENLIVTNFKLYVGQTGFPTSTYADTRITLNAMFDFDPFVLPRSSKVRCECSAWVTRSRNCSETNYLTRTDDSEIPNLSAVWTYAYSPALDWQRGTGYCAFEINEIFDFYECTAQVKLSDTVQGPAIHSDILQLPFCNRLKPRPVLFVAQSRDDVKFVGLRYFDARGMQEIQQSGGTLNPSIDFQPFIAYEPTGIPYTNDMPICADGLSYFWTFIQKSNQTCFVKGDQWIYDPGSTMEDMETVIDCFNETTGDIVCYSPKNSVFYTKMVSPDQWQLIQFNTINYRSVSVVDISLNTSCNRSLSKSTLAIDWRPFWSLTRDKDATVIFLSGDDLWSYDIGTENCAFFRSFASFGLKSKDILKFGLDWWYFYWIDTSNDLHSYSWDNGTKRILDEVSAFSGGVQKLDQIVDLIPYSPVTAPLLAKLKCLLPKFNMTASMTSPSTANLTIVNLWNNDECGNANYVVEIFPQCTTTILQYLKNISSEQSDCHSTCLIIIHQRLFADRLQAHTAEVRDLSPGCSYVFIVTAYQQLNWEAITTKDFALDGVSLSSFYNFTADYVPPPITDSPNKSTPFDWWWYFLAISLVLLLTSATVLFILTYFKQRRMKKFIDEQRIDFSQLSCIRKLGCGQFGDVWLCHYRKDKNCPARAVAVKISKHHSNHRLGGDQEMRLASADCFMQETVILNILHHKNIIQAFGFCSNYKDSSGKPAPALVLEYMNGGSAIDYVKSEKLHLSVSDFYHIFTDICRACAHLSQMGVVHRDIGARNVLVRKHPNTGKPQIAKLTDFGLAKDVGKKGLGIYKSSDRAVWHIRYTAPEGFRGVFTSKSDVWSFGIFMWELFMLIDISIEQPAEILPFSHLNSQEEILRELESNRRLPKPRLATSDLFLLMGACWSLTPEMRPKFTEMLTSLEMFQKVCHDERLVTPSRSQVSDQIFPNVALPNVHMGMDIDFSAVQPSRGETEGHLNYVTLTLP